MVKEISFPDHIFLKGVINGYALEVQKALGFFIA